MVLIPAARIRAYQYNHMFFQLYYLHSRTPTEMGLMMMLTRPLFGKFGLWGCGRPLQECEMHSHYVTTHVKTYVSFTYPSGIEESGHPR
jgi:hypothetical protein